MTISDRRIGFHSMDGFTLVELMIVIVVISILASVGYPSYTQFIAKSNRQAAKDLIYQVADRQEQFFLDNRSYAANLSTLGFASDTMGVGGDGQITASTDADRTYIFDLTNATATTYTVRMIPQLVQADRDSKCGTLTLTHRGVQGNSGTATNCW